MHPLIYILYTINLDRWTAHRKEYDDPLDKALSDIFVFSSWNDKTYKRKLMIQSLEDGWLKMKERAPTARVDLLSLSNKGKEYIKTRLEFNAL